NQYKFRDRVLRNEKYKLYINSNREPEKFFDLKADPYEKHNIIDSVISEERKTNFELLIEVVESFPEKDNDPQYEINPPQEWDVEITAESGRWKL
ncbi:MAG TPA: hypothetical protein VKA10_05795, partial [Prolixibacteraceae bacterium]|nr:hypothetical protein [Prolixibacteraceae bacterium]